MSRYNINEHTKPNKKAGLSNQATFVIIIVLSLLLFGIGAYLFYNKPTRKIVEPTNHHRPVVVTQTASDTTPTPKPPIDKKTPDIIPPEPIPDVDNKPVNPNFCPIEEIVKNATAKTNYQVYGGIPKGKNNSRNFSILNNIAFTVGYSEKRDNPIWVAYRLDKTLSPKFFKRPSYFKADDRTTARIKAKVYTKSGYDRGHMAPNKAIVSRYGKDAQLETFSMSNIVPQRPKLNRRVWKRLEGLEIKYSNKFKQIWVITGPIFDEHIEKIKEQVEIPDKFFRILIDEKDNSIRTLQFIIPQGVKGNEPLEDFLTSIDNIERETDIDFFSPLSDKYEDLLESKVPYDLWELD